MKLISIRHVIVRPELFKRPAPALDPAERARLLAEPKVTAQPPLPNAAALAKNFAGAMVRWVGAGFPILPEADYRARLEVCAGCPQWDAGGALGLGRCRMCGCAKAKLWLATERCPLKKWAK